MTKYKFPSGEQYFKRFFLLNNSELCLFLQKISIVSITLLDYITNFPNRNSTWSDLIYQVREVQLPLYCMTPEDQQTRLPAIPEPTLTICIVREVVSRQKTTKIYFHPGFSSEAVVLIGSFDSWQNNRLVFLPFGLIVYNFRGKIN